MENYNDSLIGSVNEAIVSSELVVEVIAEDIPPAMQKTGAMSLAKELGIRLAKNGKSPDFGFYFASRRICVFTNNLESEADSPIRGPRLESPDTAVSGFARKMGVQVTELLIIEDGEKYYAAKPNIAEWHNQVRNSVERALHAVSWPKSMHWNATRQQWIRPIRGMLCLLDGHPLAVQFAGLTAGDTTWVKRGEDIKISSLMDYQQKLREAKVILEHGERIKMIENQLAKAAINPVIVPSEIAVIANLCDYPQVIQCRIAEQFSTLPAPLLNAALMTCSSVVTAIEKSGAFSLSFFVVTNKTGPAVKLGYEKAANARLTDLDLLWQSDLQTDLPDLLAQSSKMTYHEKLGNYGAKSERLRGLGAYLAVYIPYACIHSIEEAALLVKLDAAMRTIREYPELQGTVAGAYIMAHGGDQKIANILTAYGNILGGQPPEGNEPVALALALADIMDSLFCLFALGNAPTASRDPFRMKKMADMLISLIINHKLERMHMFIVLQRVATNAQKLFTSKVMRANGNKGYDKRKIVLEVLSFLLARMRTLLTEHYGIAHEICNVVIPNTEIMGNRATIRGDDILLLYNQAQALETFINNPEGSAFLVAYRRASNMMVTANSRRVTARLLATTEEKEFYTRLMSDINPILRAVRNHDFTAALSMLGDLAQVVNDFLDQTKINVDCAATRTNRLAMLGKFISTANSVCDFSKIK